MKVTVDGREISVAPGSTVARCVAQACGTSRRVLAAQCGGQVLELGDTVPGDCALKILTLRDDEGRRIYERSLRFVMLLALRRTQPGRQVRIEYSVGHGVFVRLPGVALTPEQVAQTEQVMRELTAQDLPFEKKTWQKEDAVAYFAADGQEDKVALLRYRPFSFFRMYGCGGMWEYFYGAMAPSTGYVSVFALHPHEGGFVLLLPTAEQPDTPAAYVDRPKHLQVFSQSARWCFSVTSMNDMHESDERKAASSFEEA